MVFAGLLAVALAYSVLTLVAAWRYGRALPVGSGPSAPISVLKPLAGLEPDLESNLRGFFEQDYDNFEILFAVRSAADPAARVAEKLGREYPRVPSRLVITGDPPYPNAKVFSLSHMWAAAAYDLIVMSDSDTRVGPELLKTLDAELRDPGVGIATCPYRAVAGPSFWSRLEATSINTDFLAGILVARMMEGMRFAVGPTIAARRRVLESIGGFDRLKDFLAEDFVMGKFAAQEGHGVILSSYVIEHHIGYSDLRHNSAHRLRWARSTRRSRPLGYVGQIFTMPLPLAVLTVIAHPAWLPLLLVALVLRAAAADAIVRGALHARVNWALIPLADVASFCFWIAGFFGKTITWRGRRYRLHGDGRFELLRP
jgi:ceramide glucosyltransferase